MSARIKILTLVYIIILAGIIFLADLHGTDVFRFISYIPYGDKWGHFLLMGILALMVNLALNSRTIGIQRLRYLLGSLIVLAFVIVEEFSQKFLGGRRTFDYTDLLFDFAGILVFGEIARIICRKKTVRS